MGSCRSGTFVSVFFYFCIASMYFFHPQSMDYLDFWFLKHQTYCKCTLFTLLRSKRETILIKTYLSNDDIVQGAQPQPNTEWPSRNTSVPHFQGLFIFLRIHTFSHALQNKLYVAHTQNDTQAESHTSLCLCLFSLSLHTAVCGCSGTPLSPQVFKGKSFEFEIFFGKCNTSSRVKTPWLSQMYQLVW